MCVHDVGLSAKLLTRSEASAPLLVAAKAREAADRRTAALLDVFYLQGPAAISNAADQAIVVRVL